MIDQHLWRSAQWLVVVNLPRTRYNVTRLGEGTAVTEAVSRICGSIWELSQRVFARPYCGRVTCFALGGGANVIGSLHHDFARAELP